MTLIPYFLVDACEFKLAWTGETYRPKNPSPRRWHTRCHRGAPGRHHEIGVVEQVALADLLLVEGNPLENISIVTDPAKNFLILMKDGMIFKDTLSR